MGQDHVVSAMGQDRVVKAKIERRLWDRIM